MKVYLDVCCLCRLFDDQSQFRIRIETEAVEEILGLCATKLDLVSSTPILYEISQMGDSIRVEHLHGILARSLVHIKIDDSIVLRAKDLANLGIKTLMLCILPVQNRPKLYFLPLMMVLLIP